MGSATNGAYGVCGVSDKSFGVYGYSINPALGSAGVLGFTGTTHSSSFELLAAKDIVGVWADTADAATGEVGVAYPVALPANAGIHALARPWSPATHPLL
ncbi:MAG TPA: hypothetical protein VGE83_11230 [Terracidiphilus sp.]|jgi:hypothetical protein